MKYIFTAMLITVSSLPALRAESPYDREFTQLRDQRARAVAAAVEPINRKYQAALDQLLRRATQGNDLETALKIKKEMGTQTASIASPAPTTPESTEEVKGDIGADIQQSVWIGNSNRVVGMKLLFQANGTIRLYHDPKKYPDSGFWTSWTWKFSGTGLTVSGGTGKPYEDVKLDKKRTKFAVPNWGDFERAKKEPLPTPK